MNFGLQGMTIANGMTITDPEAVVVGLRDPVYKRRRGAPAPNAQRILQAYQPRSAGGG